MKKIDVLDHGLVRLVEHMGSDQSIVRAARVSYDAAWRTGENEGSDAKLIRYLWKHRHCVTVDTPVLTRDLRWVPAGDLKVGDPLIGFDEYPGKYNGSQRTYRSYRECVVTANSVANEEIWEIRFKDGSSVKCTGDHRWLAYTRRTTSKPDLGSTDAQWIRTDDLAAKLPSRRVSLPRVMQPWTKDSSWGAGMLAGAWDADGCLSARTTTSRLQFAQYENNLLSSVQGELASRGFNFSTRWSSNRSKGQTKPIAALSILGGYTEAMRFIGSCRPPRMLQRWESEQFEGLKIIQKSESEVDSISPIGRADIALLGTSTETYIADGYMAHNTSPFEAVEFQFEIKAPIFVFRQWHRHRTWSINELSARYRELPEEFYVPDPAMIGMQSSSSKQARDIRVVNDDVLSDRRFEARLMREHCEKSFAVYRRLLEKGWPRELARSVLPVNTYSHMFAKVDLRNLFHFLDLRLDAHAQYEIRAYAEAMLNLIRPIVPVAVSAWEDTPAEAA